MVPSRRQLLVYGANGYTARLLLSQLKAAGLRPIVAGRSASAVAAVADEFGFSHRVFPLSDPRRVDEGLQGVSVLVNAAGPFGRTAAPLIDSCLRQRVDYLDFSGELEPLSYAAASGRLAERLGIMLLPAIGFDVVPSDCLALHLAERLPGAEQLTLSISASNLLSRGSAATFIEHAGAWVQVRRSGALEPMRFRTQTRWVDFGQGNRPTLAVSWGDLVTAFHSTGIPNIEVYFEATAFRWLAVTTNQLWGSALRDRRLTTWLESFADLIPGGPSEADRLCERSVIVAEASRGTARARSRLVTPEAYTFSAHAAARIATEVLSGKRNAGFQTPGALFGADFVLDLPGVIREILE